MKKCYSVILLLAGLLVGCTQQAPEKNLFGEQMDHALELAQQFGPITESIAQQTAEAYDGVATDINYKSRESAERKCQTDNCMPLDLKDLARTTVVATWDSAAIGEERYEYIYSVTGVAPGMAHVYYEIIRADTSSEATIAHYKQLSREYFRILQRIPAPDE